MIAYPLDDSANTEGNSLALFGDGYGWYVSSLVIRGDRRYGASLGSGRLHVEARNQQEATSGVTLNRLRGAFGGSGPGIEIIVFIAFISTAENDVSTQTDGGVNFTLLVDQLLGVVGVGLQDAGILQGRVVPNLNFGVNIPKNTENL